MNDECFVAQANWARPSAPLDDPRLADFMSRLDAINALADRAPGFVWRLQDESGNSTGFRALGEDDLVFNLSVWRSIDELHAYVYGGAHARQLRERGRWFTTPERASHVLWWIPRGQVPTLAEAEERFARLWKCGPTPQAFTFRARY